MNDFGIILWNLFENVLKFIAFKALHLKRQDETWDKLMQFVKFGIVDIENMGSILGFCCS